MNMLVDKNNLPQTPDLPQTLNLPMTLGDLLIEAARSHGPADALVFPDKRLSYDELLAKARWRAKSLMAVGVKPGQHIGLHLPTSFEFVELMFGAALAGAVVIPINGRYVSNELAYVVENGDLVTLITTDQVAEQVNFLDRVIKALPDIENQKNPLALKLAKAPRLNNIVILGQSEHPACVSRSRFESLAESVSDSDLDARIAAVQAGDIALILYTSGTTSNPKGCLIAHENIVANSRALGRDRYQLTSDDRFWSPLPIFHIAGILPLVAVMDVGGAYLMIPYFEAGMALHMLEVEKATATYPCFVTIMQDLIGHPDFANTDLSKVRLMNSSFAVQPPGIKEAMEKSMPQAIQVGTYGLTEASGTICTSALDDPYEIRTTRLGKPLKGWEVRIINPETGLDCPPGVHGEIVARGPGRLIGYYKDPVKTAEAIDKDGWLHTGDMGSLDAGGNIMFHGRTKDMLKIGGENVAAAEIEARIGLHPAVKLAQIVGVPHPRLVEVAAAFVELKPGMTATEDEIIAFCKGEIASFKVPRYVRFVTSWPMSTSKIQKFRLRDQLIAELNKTQAATR
jgi:fatty-acyl-CoA synthase